MMQSIGRTSVLALLPEDYLTIVQGCLDSGESRLGCDTALGRRTVSWSFFPIPENKVVHCYGEEITNRLELETQLRQLQKMECVGQLAAGLDKTAERRDAAQLGGAAPEVGGSAEPEQTNRDTRPSFWSKIVR